MSVLDSLNKYKVLLLILISNIYLEINFVGCNDLTLEGEGEGEDNIFSDESLNDYYDEQLDNSPPKHTGNQAKLLGCLKLSKSRLYYDPVQFDSIYQKMNKKEHNDPAKKLFSLIILTCFRKIQEGHAIFLSGKNFEDIDPLTQINIQLLNLSYWKTLFTNNDKKQLAIEIRKIDESVSELSTEQRNLANSDDEILNEFKAGDSLKKDLEGAKTSKEFKEKIKKYEKELEAYSSMFTISKEEEQFIKERSEANRQSAKKKNTNNKKNNNYKKSTQQSSEILVSIFNFLCSFETSTYNIIWKNFLTFLAIYISFHLLSNVIRLVLDEEPGYEHADYD